MSRSDMVSQNRQFTAQQLKDEIRPLIKIGYIEEYVFVNPKTNRSITMYKLTAKGQKWSKRH